MFPFISTAYAKVRVQRTGLILGVGLAMLISILLPLNLLVTQRFHHDEALYATWALNIASGQNIGLAETPIDKPPLFLYAVAASLWLLGHTETAARLPSLLATAFTVGLTFLLAKKLYGNRTGLLAAWLVALSPFTLLFAPTAFTDPMLVMWVMAGCVAAVYGRAGWAGILMGLAIATKQQGIFFVPLGILLLATPQLSSGRSIRSLFYPLRNFLIALFITVIPIFIWDFARNQSPGFWQLSVINYGGLQTNAANFSQRWHEFLALLKYATGSPILNTIFVVGLPLLLIFGSYDVLKNKYQKVYYDWVFTFFCLGFLLIHTWFSFQVWDRYLLGLIPFLAILFARILWLPWTILNRYVFKHRSKLQSVANLTVGLLLVILLAATLTRPVQDAVNARYPLAANSHALGGIEQIVAYLQGHTNADTTLYHNRLGTHWRFYLWNYPYDLQYWSSAATLADHAQPKHLIAFPSWQSETEARLALAEKGLVLQELTRAYTSAGNPSIILYKIVDINEK